MPDIVYIQGQKVKNATTDFDNFETPAPAIKLPGNMVVGGELDLSIGTAPATMSQRGDSIVWMGDRKMS